jgi:hypothetical protein
MGAIESPAVKGAAESAEYNGKVCFAAIKSAAVPMMIAILTSLDMWALSSDGGRLGRCRAG